MADHVLQQIRVAMKALLDGHAGVATAFMGRRSEYPKGTVFPVINIRSIEESVDRMDTDDGLLRDGVIDIEVTMVSDDDCEPDLFGQQKYIELAVASDPTLGGLVDGLTLISSRQEEREDSDAEQNIEKRVLRFAFQTATRMGAPDVVIL